MVLKDLTKANFSVRVSILEILSLVGIQIRKERIPVLVVSRRRESEKTI